MFVFFRDVFFLFIKAFVQYDIIQILIKTQSFNSSIHIFKKKKKKRNDNNNNKYINKSTKIM